MATLIETLVGASIGTMVFGLVWGATGFQLRQAARTDSLASAVSIGHTIENRLLADLRCIAISPNSPNIEPHGLSFITRENDAHVRVTFRYDAGARAIDYHRGSEVRRFGEGRVERFDVSRIDGRLRWELGVHAPEPRDEVIELGQEVSLQALARREAHAFWEGVAP
jgi:hypothetical protein